MYEEKKIIKKFNLKIPPNIKNTFSVTDFQDNKLTEFLKELITHNKHTNLVGKSTLLNPWTSHVLDCIQVSLFIKNKNE